MVKGQRETRKGVREASQISTLRERITNNSTSIKYFKGRIVKVLDR